MRGMAIDKAELERLTVHIDKMDEVIREDGTIECMPYEYWAQFPSLAVTAWANKRGYYCLPTTELIEWLTDRIAGRYAIEVASGSNGLYRHLGITGTDSRMQADPVIAMLYAMSGQKITEPPADVKTIDANAAVRELEPQVVVASWLTEYVSDEDVAAGRSGSMFGAHEEEIVNSVEEFILIGATGTHGGKRIMDMSHEEHEFPWLVSRAVDPSSNRIWTWSG